MVYLIVTGFWPIAYKIPSLPNSLFRTSTEEVEYVNEQLIKKKALLNFDCNLYAFFFWNFPHTVMAIIVRKPAETYEAIQLKCVGSSQSALGLRARRPVLNRVTYRLQWW